MARKLAFDAEFGAVECHLLTIHCLHVHHFDFESFRVVVRRRLDGFDASCFDGVYITGDVTAETIAALNSSRADTAEKIGEEGDVDASRLALPNPQEA